MSSSRRPWRDPRYRTPAQEARLQRLEDERREYRERAQAQKMEKRRKAIYKSKIVAERGIDGELLSRLEWREIFEGREWMKLAEQPARANLDLVREFYFVIDQERLERFAVVDIRGIEVRVTPQAINSYYDTPDIPDCQLGFTRVVRQMEDAELLRHLCSPDHDKTARNTGLSDFTYEVHLWNLFVSYSILPIGRRSGFTTQRLRTLFALQNGHAIDLGQLILAQLEEHGKGQEHSSLVFPSLITGLCQAAGIEVDAPGEQLTVPGMIGFKSVNYIRTLRDLPKLLTPKEMEAADRRASGASSSRQSSASVSRPSSSSRQSTASTTSLEELMRQNNIAQQEMVATQQQMIAAQQEMMATIMQNRAEDQEKIARLDAQVQELQHKMMYGQVYQRRSRPRD